MRCQNCGKEVGNNEICPHCGAVVYNMNKECIENTSKNNKKEVKHIGVIVFLGIILAALYFIVVVPLVNFGKNINSYENMVQSFKEMENIEEIAEIEEIEDLKKITSLKDIRAMKKFYFAYRDLVERKSPESLEEIDEVIKEIERIEKELELKEGLELKEELEKETE